MDREQREQLIELLRGLASDDPDLVVDHARRASALVEATGLDWSEVVAAPRGGRDVFTPDFDHGDFDLDEEDGDSAPSPLDTADDSVGRTLRRLLDLDVLSDETRADIEGFAADLAAGNLDEQDRRYVQALAARLGVL